MAKVMVIRHKPGEGGVPGWIMWSGRSPRKTIHLSEATKFTDREVFVRLEEVHRMARDPSRFSIVEVDE